MTPTDARLTGARLLVAVSAVLLALLVCGARKPPARSQPLRPGREFYVSPNGRPAGDGTASRPWDLATALSGSKGIRPGDTIWLRGGTYAGTYRSRLTGTAQDPVLVRQYPGERAVIDGGNSNGNGILVVSGSYTW